MTSPPLDRGLGAAGGQRGAVSGERAAPAREEKAEVERLCATCHTLGYISGQPLLAKKTWEKVLEKHIHEYGAPLTAEASARVLAYVLTFKEKR